MAEPPRILVIDDLFGRTLPDRRNEERANLCGQYLLDDVTGDELGRGPAQRVKRPVARVVFVRGQAPRCAAVGDTVENDLSGTLEIVRAGWRGWPRWAMVLLDLCFYTGRVVDRSDRVPAGMPEGRDQDEDPAGYFGLRLLRAIHNEFPDLPVVILSGMPREEVSRACYQSGARAFLPRSEGREADRLRDCLEKYGLIEDQDGLIVGHSAGLLAALAAARRASPRGHILIRGERGTGKELLAQYLHRRNRSGSVRGPLVKVDSGTLSSTLYASELFGHARGAFTGASQERRGSIVLAHGGDLFLDEIGNMPADVQKGMLRVLEQREVCPVGASEPVPVDVRVIAATNEDLEVKAVAGEFRKDLLDRLRQSGTIDLPPLRERKEDLEPMVLRFIRAAEDALPGATRRTVEPEALARLRSHDWPGNIRELRNCIWNAVNDYPDVEHLVPLHLNLNPSAALADPIPMVQSPAAGCLDELLMFLRRLDPERATAKDVVGALPRVWDAFALSIAELVKVALRETARPTPDTPEGEILIHPAMKLLTGDKKLTAAQAADTVKRCLNLAPEVISRMADPLLKRAYDRAVRLRPRGPAKTARPGQSGAD